MSLIGYARVSTEEQNLDLQLAALERAGCERIYQDLGISGASTNRDGLNEALAALNGGDVLAVWKLDRLGRSLPHLIDTIASLADRKVEFRSLTENIDTQSAGGRLIFHIMGALAEFERSLISERTRAGMTAARDRGQHLGRRPSLSREQARHAAGLVASGQTVASVARLFGVTRQTVYRHLKR
jgi:DNA invertase Pin-like site-specific DNA recombinase